VNTEQCTSTSGLSGTSISGTCGVYDTSCRTKCEGLNSETCPSRSDDCFGVKDGNGDFGQCINGGC
jgi:hypothetical protein